ncbi:MAG: PadR family transcriptional regulator [Planctomycetaceae bacterium]|nr:PadR family transcriptional regulator [Planctomycetaceae bacterium]
MSHNIPLGLSDVQFVLLGLVIDTEKSGTELRQILRDDFGWDTSTSSFYTYFERLGKEGFCTIKTTKAGKKFKATAKGKKAYKSKFDFMKQFTAKK